MKHVTLDQSDFLTLRNSQLELHVLAYEARDARKAADDLNMQLTVKNSMDKKLRKELSAKYGVKLEGLDIAAASFSAEEIPVEAKNVGKDNAETK